MVIDMLANDFCTLNCANCSFTDGLCYTSLPPKYRCTFDNNFYDGYHACHLELAPVRHGRWDDDHKCTVCRAEALFTEKPDPYAHGILSLFYVNSEYCPNCGAKMDLE